MSKRPWYKRYGGDFIVGTMALSLEEKGAYSICLDLIYDRGAPIPDDARWLAGVCGISVRRWRTIKARLIHAGKIHVKDGMLTNDRAERELASIAVDRNSAAENGAEGGLKRAENAAKTAQKPAEKEPDLNEINGVGQAYPEARIHIEAAAVRGAGIAVSELAWKLARELAEIAGHDAEPPGWPPGWNGGPMRIQGWLNEGWDENAILAGARNKAAKSKGVAIWSVQFFEGAIADERARQARPLPTGNAGPSPQHQPAKSGGFGVILLNKHRERTHAAQQSHDDPIDDDYRRTAS